MFPFTHPKSNWKNTCYSYVRESVHPVDVLFTVTISFCQRPSQLSTQSVLYLHYKILIIRKDLIGISLCGSITFISQLFDGAILDRQMFSLISAAINLSLPARKQEIFNTVSSYFSSLKMKKPPLAIILSWIFFRDGSRAPSPKRKFPFFKWNHQTVEIPVKLLQAIWIL